MNMTSMNVDQTLASTEEFVVTTSTPILALASQVTQDLIARPILMIVHMHLAAMEAHASILSMVINVSVSCLILGLIVKTKWILAHQIYANTVLSALLPQIIWISPVSVLLDTQAACVMKMSTSVAYQLHVGMVLHAGTQMDLILAYVLKDTKE